MGRCWQDVTTLCQQHIPTCSFREGQPSSGAAELQELKLQPGMKGKCSSSPLKYTELTSVPPVSLLGAQTIVTAGYCTTCSADELPGC